MAHKIAILTCVGNAKGIGPGHSAIVLWDQVYTFEELAGFYGDSWKIIKATKYLQENEHRPVVVQELKEIVDISKVATYVQGSIQRDDDYAGSGVCSSQVASAINAGLLQEFNPTRIDTPWEVHRLAKSKGIVKRSYYAWPGEIGVSAVVRMHLQDRLEREFAGVTHMVPRDGILTW